MEQTRNKKELKTEFSYNRLWKMLIDIEIKKMDLQKMSDVSGGIHRKNGLL